MHLGMASACRVWVQGPRFRVQSAGMCVLCRSSARPHHRAPLPCLQLKHIIMVDDLLVQTVRRPATGPRSLPRRPQTRGRTGRTSSRAAWLRPLGGTRPRWRTGPAALPRTRGATCPPRPGTSTCLRPTTPSCRRGSCRPCAICGALPGPCSTSACRCNPSSPCAV